MASCLGFTQSKLKRSYLQIRLPRGYDAQIRFLEMPKRVCEFSESHGYTTQALLLSEVAVRDLMLVEAPKRNFDCSHTHATALRNLNATNFEGRLIILGRRVKLKVHDCVWTRNY